MPDAVDQAPDGLDKKRLAWILRNSVGDVNYISTLADLTDEELTYCVEHEIRKSGLRLLVSEMHRRSVARRRGG